MENVSSFDAFVLFISKDWPYLLLLAVYIYLVKQEKKYREKSGNK